MSKKIIKSEASSSIYPTVLPIKNIIPKWYKDTKQWLNGEPAFYDTAIKHCMPFFDSLTTGYYLPLVGDLLVKKVNDFSSEITWGGKDDLVEFRDPKFSGELPVPTGYSPAATAWVMHTALEIPDGYSMLLVHPMNRFDLPFITVSGVVDSFTMHPGRIPFFLKSDFEGTIPQGTPIAQIIPFKTEEWKAINEEGLYNKSLLNKERSNLVLSGWYKKTYWKKKKYE